MTTRFVRAAAVVSAVALASAALVACSSSDGGSAAPAASASAGASSSGAVVTDTTRPADTVLDVLVTNDDGVGAAGIDAVAKAIAALPGTKVSVVAPAANQSGTGGKTSGGSVSHNDDTTASGQRATAVSGFPADAVNVALDDLGLKPDLVVSGINEGQNLGPVVDLSGTVGAARAAARRGIPALAASEGLGDTYDYSAGVTQVLAWIASHRTALLTTSAAGGRSAGDAGGAASTQTVANLNIPNCFAGGSVRGLRELPSEPKAADPATILAPQHCTATDTPPGEIAAFNAGFATLTTVPAQPTS